MKMMWLIFAAAAMAASARMPGSRIAFQQAGAIIRQPAGGGLWISQGAGIMAPQGVAGSPLSAVEQMHSLQVLADGTRIEHSESQRVYRDSMGRTRVESGEPGKETVAILDPVGGFNITLEPETLTARKAALPKLFVNGGNVRYEQVTQSALSGGVTGTTYLFRTPDGRQESLTAFPAGTAKGIAQLRDPSAPPRETVENLPAQNINGVMATGRKVIMTIPAGEIGNDRPIREVSESWFSRELNMVVKSSNSDPRFGDTSFELTNIVRSEPDPRLFQIPAGYTVSERNAK